MRRAFVGRRGGWGARLGLLAAAALGAACGEPHGPAGAGGAGIDFPVPEIVEAYRQAADNNVLAAVNPKVFFGYWSVCADGQGFGYGNTYPSLDGHQMTDALLWLGRIDVVKANWSYVRSFQRPDGSLPLAILPSSAGGRVGSLGQEAAVAANGGLYEHWLAGNPLRALADPTYIQNADDIFRMTRDVSWLRSQMPSVNLAVAHLASLVDRNGAVGGAGYYVERPLRRERDGVSQCHAVDAFRRAAALNRIVGDSGQAEACRGLARRVQDHFTAAFWIAGEGRFAEYDHPERGRIFGHGLTDVDWAALALDVATEEQAALLWPKLKDESGFHYGGMPTGIASRPEAYEDWEFTYPDRHDLAAMGRVWMLEAQARASRGDAEGLKRGLLAVCREGARHGYRWRERYRSDGRGSPRGDGPDGYCEYPANLIRVVQRFLFGLDFRRDGALAIDPAATDEDWALGFGQPLRFGGRVLEYRMGKGRLTGTYAGDAPLALVLREDPAGRGIRAAAGGRRLAVRREVGRMAVILPAAPSNKPVRFVIRGIGRLKPS